MTFAEAALLGLIQGLAEWLPVSSEGVLTAVQSLAFGDSLTDAVNFSLWLHIGTALSALAALRTDVWDVLRNVVSRPTAPSPITAYLVVATISSAPIGFLLLTGLFEFSERVGAAAMVVVGVLMLVTGALLLRSRSSGTRTRDDVRWPDAVLTGIAQGLAALPGLSRSGLTVGVLLWRGVDRREALILSFLLSVPASLGAGLYAAISAGYYASPQAAVALAVSAVTGFATIRALMAVGRRLNFGWFVLLMGAAIVAGAALTVMN
ncbi:MAG: undecaprenyl-diphosphate phosphatase [Dehalococcoidia bacterium]|nr:undecaprenyl-diphosphate phosphatase [Dehalococcoidia bacterium]